MSSFCFWKIRLLLLFVVLIIKTACWSYEIPDVKLEPINNGFSLSLSDDQGIRKVIYYININDKCPGYIDLVLDGNPDWKITQTSNTPLKDKDKINISILVDHNGEAYKDKQYIVVGENNNVAIKTPNNTPTTPCGGISGDEKPQPPTEVCEPSQTIVKGLKKICKHQLIFEENFSDAQIDLSKWSFDIRNLLTARQNEEFVLYDNSHENIFIADGILNIKPTFTQVNARMAAIDFGSRCTPVENNIKECKASTQFPFNYVPPINSSNINTRNTFQFKYGRVEIRAKLPKGNWLLPYITLENYGTFQRRQMRIAFARGNEQLLITNPMKDIGGRRLYGGLVKYFDQYENNLKELYANEHFGNDFHIYTLIWTNNSIAVSVDGRTYGEFQENLNDCNDEFFISLGVSAGGHLEFPDNLVNPEHKPWKNTSPKAIGIFWQNIKDGLISWADDNQTMRIDYVRMYAV